MFSRLESLRQQFNAARDAMSAIEAAATADGGRELTEAEAAEIATLTTRCEQLGEEIAPLAKRAESINATAAILGRITPSAAPAFIGRAQPKPEDIAKMTAGEYLSLHWRQANGDADAGQLITRAVAGMTTTDNGGVIPVPIVGELVKLADDSRPVFNSFTPQPMPGKGKTFTRPRVTQRVSVGNQAAELDEVSSQKMTITGDTVTKKTYAGVLEISEQDIDWTEPAVLDLVLTDFIGVYAQVTENWACDALEALGTTTAVWDATDVTSIVSSILTGVQTVYNAAKRMPDTCWLSLDELLGLAGTVNTTETATALTVIRQALADAGVPLRFITGPQLTAETIILGASSLVEVYEQQKGFISAANVSHLGADIAYRGYVASYGRAAGFVKLEAA